MSDETIDPQLSAFASKLQALAPRSSDFNRDRLLFLAGQASAHRQANFWRIWAAGSTLAALTMFGLVGLRPVPESDRLETVQVVPAEQTVSETLVSTDFLADFTTPQFQPTHESFSQMELRKLAFQHGVDALPQQAVSEVEEHRQSFSGQHILSAGSQSLESANP
jgi:hypothetical protein